MQRNEAATDAGKGEVGRNLVPVVQDRHLMPSRKQLPCKVEAEKCMATALRVDDEHRVSAGAFPHGSAAWRRMQPVSGEPSAGETRLVHLELCTNKLVDTLVTQIPAYSLDRPDHPSG